VLLKDEKAAKRRSVNLLMWMVSSVGLPGIHAHYHGSNVAAILNETNKSAKFHEWHCLRDGSSKL
jgi:hypothetical protein